MPSSLRVISTASLPTARASSPGAARELGVGSDRPMDGGSQFQAIWREQRRAAIDAVIVALWIDNDGYAETPGVIDEGAYHAGRQHALGEVGQHHSVNAGQRLPRMRNNGRLAMTARRIGRLPISPDQMARIMFGYKADLARGLPRRINHELGVNQSAEAGELFC